MAAEKRRMGKIPPPSHPYYLRSSNKDREGNEEVLGDSSPFKKCRRIESLPDDLLFEILVRLPAQDIRDHARFVCWKWYRMIRTHKFLYEHFKHLSYGLLFCVNDGPQFFITEQLGRIEISKLNYRLWSVRHTCNGLCLELGNTIPNTIHVRNPITEKKLILPRLSSGITVKSWRLGIAYSAVSMVYKLVFINVSFSGPYRCFIITVGVDETWRSIEIGHLDPTTFKLLRYSPLITEGFMVWAANGPLVLTLNIETEMFTVIPVPSFPKTVSSQKLNGGRENRFRFNLSTGRYLSMVTGCRGGLWDVLEMKPETGEWRKVCDFYIGGSFDHTKHNLPLIVLGWLKYPEVLVFYDVETIFFYNLVTQKIEWLDALLPTPIPLSPLSIISMIVHKNSLCWLGGC